MELCKSLESTLEKLDAARSGAQFGEDIGQRTSQWNQKLSDLLAAHQRADWLQVKLSQVATYPGQFASARDLALQAADRLEQRLDLEVLTKDNLWVRLLQTTQTTSAAAWEQVKRAWRSEVEQYRQLTPIQQLRATAAPLPQNDALLNQYEMHYRDASRLASLEVPRSSSDPEAITQAIRACRTLVTQLRFDAPKEVEEFFRAINAGTATLTLVTPSVLAWLADNDLLAGYTVRSSAR